MAATAIIIAQTQSDIAGHALAAAIERQARDEFRVLGGGAVTVDRAAELLIADDCERVIREALLRVVVVTPVRLFGESLAACFSGEGEIEIAGVVADLESLSRHIAETPPDLVLIDISQGFDLEEIGALAATHSGITLVALGLREQREEVIRHARAGFQAYVARDAALATLEQALIDARAGRLRCPAEIAAGLMDALRRMAPPSRDAARLDSLTRREEDVLRLIGRGLSNKEIANELALSVATVKHHVHAILGKLALTGRTQAMRRVRATPWLNG